MTKDTYNHKGWMQSDNLFKRAAATFGHNMLGVLMMYAVAFVIAFIVGALI